MGCVVELLLSWHYPLFRSSYVFFATPFQCFIFTWGSDMLFSRFCFRYETRRLNIDLNFGGLMVSGARQARVQRLREAV